MKFAVLTTTAALGTLSLLAVTGCQNSGAHAEADVDRPAMTATNTTSTETTASARVGSTAYVATTDTRYVLTPTDTANGGTLRSGDVVYFDNNTAVTNGATNETGYNTTSANGNWRMARTADGRTVFVHPQDFRPR